MNTEEKKEPEQPKMTMLLLVKLKQPVKLPTTFTDAIKDGNLEDISAFDLPLTEEAIR